MRSLRIGLAAFALLVYLALPTKNYYWDGISFAQTIEDASHWPQLLHPNHLIYNLIGWSVYRGLGAHFRALYVLQAMNAVWAGLALYLLSGILVTALRSARAMLLLGTLFAFAGTWWRYATDADAYIPSVTLLIACAIFLLPGSRPRPVAVALLHTAAMLVHQLAVLLVPATLFALWHQYPEDTPSAIRSRGLMLYLGLAGSFTLGAYGWGFAALNGGFSTRAFLSWMTSYAGDAAFSFRLFRSAGVSIRGWLQLFFIGRPSLLRYSNPQTIVLLLLCASALILLLIGLRRIHFRIRIYQPLLFRFSLLWTLAYAAFLFFWLPSNTFYKVFALPGVVLMAASCWEPRKDPLARGPGWAFVCLLMLANLTMGVLPYSRESSNEVAAFASGLKTAVTPGSVVFFHTFTTDDWYARYFNPQSQWKHADSTAVVDSELRAGKSVWLETTATERFSVENALWLRDRTRGTERQEWIKPNRRLRFLKLANP